MLCSKCGASLVEDAKFCGKCGGKQGEQSNPAPTSSVRTERNNKIGLIYGLIGIGVIIVIIIFLSNNFGGGNKSRTMVGAWELSLQDGEVPLGLPATITFAGDSSDNRGTGYYVGGVTNIRYDFTWSISGSVFDMSRFPGDQGIIVAMGSTEIKVDLKAGEITFWYPNGSYVEYTRK